ncbi:hypothetical protein GCK72_020589 [Caenorhabditis remanei]|uniref:Uncharacterized protein n=1 Tax=Caenorhabditis remanei TaxID=31234 RepID=A0A6A5GHE2_CAERE|nr:hypothetical protein GCK72_020589 [Caenorhabditis remanei]KAF1754031.1 hypothetical protein GCK72_020589 [Caenorhabditis remanei]
MERVMAVYAPIFFHNHKHIFSPFPILAIAASFGLTEPIVLFGFCRYDSIFPKTCAGFGCAVNQCFLTYWNTHKLIILAFIFLSTILVCLKLFLMNRGKESRQLSRANRLAIIDAAIIFWSDFLPIVARKYVVFTSQIVGPNGAVLQSVGLAIESLLFYRAISRKSSVQSSDSTIQMFHKTRRKTCTC